jgi:hypothetical protein
MEDTGHFLVIIPHFFKDRMKSYISWIVENVIIGIMIAHFLKKMSPRPISNALVKLILK